MKKFFKSVDLKLRKLLCLHNDEQDYEYFDFSYRNIWLRLFGFLGDVVLMLFPVFIWGIIFLLATADLLDMRILNSIMLILCLLILILASVGNVYVSLITQGQSFGKKCLDMRVVNEDNTLCKRNKLIIRELFGKYLPIVIAYLIGSLKLTILLIVVNGLVVLIDPRHRSIIDFFTKTKVVIMRLKPGVESKTHIDEVEKISNINTMQKSDLNVKSCFTLGGTQSVEDLMKLAKEHNVKNLSICDRNSVKADHLAKQIAKLYDINYISGICIDCDYNGHRVDLLGYFIDSDDELYTKIEYEYLIREKEVSLERLRLLADELNITIDKDKLLKMNRYQIITEDILAKELLTNDKYKSESFREKYNINNIEQFIKDYMSEGKKAYVEAVNPELKDMIKAVKKTGGKCVLAHPMTDFAYNPKLLDDVIDLGLDGIEVYSYDHDVDDINFLLDLAKRKNIAITGGSYFGQKDAKSTIGLLNCSKEKMQEINEFVEKTQKNM